MASSALAGRGFDRCPHGRRDGFLIDAVDDDFVRALGAFDKLRIDPVAQAWGKRRRQLKPRGLCTWSRPCCRCGTRRRGKG